MTQHTQCLNRIARPIKNHVGGIKVNPQIRPVNVLKEREQGRRRFLSRFERKALPMPLRMVANPPHQIAYSDVVGVLMVMRHEANMGPNRGNAQLRRKVRKRDRASLPFGARTRRDKAYCPLDRRDVRVILARVSAKNRHQREVFGLTSVLPEGCRTIQQIVPAHAQLT